MGGIQAYKGEDLFVVCGKGLRRLYFFLVCVEWRGARLRLTFRVADNVEILFVLVVFLVSSRQGQPRQELGSPHRSRWEW